ncbi:MAG: riboflavin biosynthesis protein RibF [Elusimicrobia bacterium CG1_02_63_36]|nr:MAG: riboflavin biosynthesis protein RibF [Elusimicrobia bacterium CG1_02_63_36]
MPEKKYLVTIGTFDGVHLGHQKLIRWAMNRARALKMRSRVVFFVSPPRFFFRPSLKVPLLTTGPERRAFLHGLGVDRVEVLRFGSRWAEMPHERFFEDYVIKRWKAGGILVGKDFAFGKGRKGDLPYLQRETAARGMHLSVLPLVRVGGKKISSSGIRSLLAKGDAERAARMLGRPYALTGTAARGRGLGRKLGFPTANLRLPAEVLTPPGVFLVRVAGGPLRGPRDAVCNVGLRPTVNRRGRRLVVEVHVPGFSGDLYGARLKLEFIRRLRGERKFASLEALKRQIGRDIQAMRGRSA